MNPAKPDVDHNLQLAAERTLLAWIRTGLALMGFGFVVARFGLFLRELTRVPENPLVAGSGSLGFGVGLVGVGVGVLAVAGWRFQRYTSALRAGEDVDPPGQGFGVIVCGVLVLLGSAMAVYLLSINSLLSR